MKADHTNRFDIPIGHLDYDYIGKCKDIKELEKILVILRSGDEGSYPDLEAFAEKKLQALHPESRILRKEEKAKTIKQLQKTEQEKILEDLSNWTDQMKDVDQGLKSGHTSKDVDLPPVRGANSNIPVSESKVNKPGEQTKKSRRVKPRDYKEWEKVDLDAELEKVDKEDEQRKGKVKKAKSKVKAQIPETVEVSDLDDIEKILRANREKDKGNESFRAGDFQEALVYYRRSLSIVPTIAARNNCAQANVKLEKWDDAVADCSEVLKEEPGNLKALLRRGTAHKGKKNFTKAKHDLQKVLEQEPQNKRAQELMKQVEKALLEKRTKGHRIVIEEVEEEEAEENKAKPENKEKYSPKKGCIIKEMKDKSEAGNKQVENKTHSKPADSIEQSGVKGKTETSKGKESVSKEESAAPSAGKKKRHRNRKKNKTKGNNQVEDVHANGSESNRPQVDVNAKKESNKENHQSVAFSQPTTVPVVANTGTGGTTMEVRACNGEPEPAITASAPPPLPDSVTFLKDAGNELYKKGQYAEATERYTKAINKLLPVASKHGLNLAVLYSNRSASRLKAGDCSGCVEDCSAALDLHPGLTKAISRRAQAYETLEKYRLAYVDYQRAMCTDNSIGPQIQQGISRCSQHLQMQDGSKWREKLPKASPKTIPVSPVSQTVEKSQQSLPPVKQSAEEFLEEEFEKYKDQGKNLVQKGEFMKAAECYTQCIKLFPGRAVSYSNRALCNLKMNKIEQVVSDCNEALRLEPLNIKALFRRGQAHKTLKHYTKSVQDFEALLKIDPKNAAAKKELQLSKKQLEQEEKQAKEMTARESEKKRQRLKIEEVEESSDEENESTAILEGPDSTPATCKKPAQSSTSQEISKNVAAAAPAAPAVAAAKYKLESDQDFESRYLEKNGTVPPTSATVSSHVARPADEPVEAILVPQLSKITPYEFIQAWTTLKKTKDPVPYAELLQQIDPTDLPKVISNKLDDHMLLAIIRSVEIFVDQGLASRALVYLQQLTVVPRFQTITMFMSPAERKDLERVLSKLSDQAACPLLQEDLRKLRKDYSLE